MVGLGGSGFAAGAGLGLGSAFPDSQERRVDSKPNLSSASTEVGRLNVARQPMVRF